ncbi:MAG: PASTA domain-containing protein, partial [Flavobacteriales bacterium]|nr:PASTA domain-containing protein [Flavobacteriales bacterium]
MDNVPQQENTTSQKKNVSSFSIFKFSICAIVALALLVVIAIRMVSFIFTGDELRRAARQDVIQERPVPARWGNIYSADGYLMASTVLRYDFHWDIALVNDTLYNKDTVAHGRSIKLNEVLCDSMSKYFPRRTAEGWKAYFDRARSHHNHHLTIATNITQLEKDLLLTFPIFKYYTKKRSPARSGVKIESYSKRITPLRGMADRVLGKSETNAYVGLEGYYATYLKGEEGSRLMQHIRGEWKPLADGNRKDPVDGKDVVLTLEARTQNMVHLALEEQMKKWKAERGCAIVMDVKTGGIRAMVNLARLESDTSRYYELQNYAVGELSDPGSTFKLMSFMAMAEEGVLDTTQKISTEGGVITIHGKNIRDYKAGGYGVISAHKAFVKSSNTATVKLAYNSFKDRPQDFMNRLRSMYLDKKSGIDIAGEPDPHIPTPGTSSWSALSMPWTSYGYEVRLTPLQTVSFYNAVANDGVYVEPHLLQEVRRNGETLELVSPTHKGKVASQKTIKIAQDLLRSVVDERGGTAHSACYDPDLRIAGKTGTAQYNYGRGEKMQYMVSFAGYFPYDAPQYSMVVCIYKPQGWPISGGVIAAPVAKTIARGIYSATPREVYTTTIENINSTRPSAGQVSEARKFPDSIEMMIDARGAYVTDVVNALEKNGYTVKINGGIGIVSAQSPAKGTRLKKGQTITLTTR